MEKKNIAILILAVALVASGIGNIFLAIGPEVEIAPPDVSKSFVFGTSNGPRDLDSVKSWDSASNDVIEQVAEGLYMYNLSDPNLAIVPRLASDYGTWDVTGTQFTIPLRQNVTFHDGTKFNASSVAWNFERLNYFINASGMSVILNESVAQIHSLYEFPNGTTILDPVTPVTINSEYSVTINLRAPYAVFEPLICYVTAYQLSPASTPKYEYISTAYGDLVGTGPFVYDYYVADTEVKFHRFDDYWREVAFFEEMTFAIIEDAVTRNNAMLGHSIDYLSGSMTSLFPTFDADATITHRSGERGMGYSYLGMNNKQINKTWRQAISYAINYTYIISTLQDDTVYRANGPLAPTFPGFDDTVKAATYNLAMARSLIQSMGLAGALTADNATTGTNADDWKALTLQTWNYTYNIGNDFREDMSVLLTDNLNLIGIDVVDEGISWSDFLDRAYGYSPGGYDTVMLYWIGWGPDYLSPFNMIDPLFSSTSTSNAAQYNNTDVQGWLADVLVETDPVARDALYSQILTQIVEVDMPHVFGYHPYGHSIHSADLRGVSYNAMGGFYPYTIYRV